MLSERVIMNIEIISLLILILLSKYLLFNLIKN